MNIYKKVALTYAVLFGICILLITDAKADQMDDYRSRQEAQRQQLIQDMTWWNSQQLLEEQRRMREEMEKERRNRAQEEHQQQLINSFPDRY